MNKVLTISIAAYNVKDYIKKCVESIFTDNPEIDNKIEVIAVDDGANDGTSALLDELAKEYSNLVVVHKENGGYGSTINASLKIAKGKYFKQLDGDDWFETSNMADFVDYLEKTDADLVLSPYYNDYEETGECTLNSNVVFEKTAKVTDISAIDCDINIAMHELAIKTELARDNKMKISENCFYTDNELVLIPFLYAENISAFDKGIYHYRIGREGQSMSKSGIIKHYKDIMIVAEKLLGLVKDINIDNNFAKKKFIDSKMIEVIIAVYVYFVYKNTSAAKQDLKAFDKKLKEEYPSLYRDSSKSNIVKILRMSQCILYKPLAFMLNK